MHYKELIDEIRKAILKHASPVRIYLYGSRATGEAGETSDIDIAYDDKECKGHHLIEEEIRKLPTLVKIDVKNIAFTEERFRNRVIATGKVLFSATKKLRFEFTYEMSWKCIKRYLDYIGIECHSPRDCFKEAFSQKAIADEMIWIDMIGQRNISSHVYDEDEIKEILGKIGDYKNAFQGLLQTLEERLKRENLKE